MSHDHSDESLAFYTTDQLINEVLKRFDTSIFVGDMHSPSIGDTRFAVWDRNKDIVRAFGLVEWSKFRLMKLLDEHSHPAGLDFLDN